MASDKDGSPTCGIYVRIDNFSNMLDAIGWVRKLAFTINRGSGYDRNMAVVELVCSQDNTDKVRDLIPIIKDNGLVAIVSGSCNPLGGDGVFIDKVDDSLSSLREALGNDAIIGTACIDKTQAEAAIKAGVDFVDLMADPSLISWFASKSDIICLASGGTITADNCGMLAHAGAGLIDVSDYILNHKKGIAQGTVNILHAIEKSTCPPQKAN